MRTEQQIKQEGKQLFGRIDFTRIRCCMALLGWEWYDDKSDKLEVPTIVALQIRLNDLMEKCFNGWSKEKTKQHYTISSGGFEVELDKFGVWRVCFVLEEQDSE